MPWLRWLIRMTIVGGFLKRAPDPEMGVHAWLTDDNASALPVCCTALCLSQLCLFWLFQPYPFSSCVCAPPSLTPNGTALRVQVPFFMTVKKLRQTVDFAAMMTHFYYSTSYSTFALSPVWSRDQDVWREQAPRAHVGGMDFRMTLRVFPRPSRHSERHGMSRA